MHGRVIQGFFQGTLPPARTVQAFAPAAAQRAAAVPSRDQRVGPPAPAFSQGPVQRRAAPAGGGGSFAIDPVQIGLARGGGKPLPQALLAKMEAAFAADFSSVRVHVGPQASRIGALAFTTGNDLYFAPGQYQPDSVKGQQLIGHELAHVIQQRAGRVRAPGSGVAVVQDHALEAEADRLGMRAAAWRAPTAGPGAQAVQRKAAAAGPPGQLIPPGRPASNGRSGAIQRMEMPTSTAKKLVDGWSGKPGWYEDTFAPALMAMAIKSGTSFEKLIAKMSKDDLRKLYDHLQIDPYSFWNKNFDLFNFGNDISFVKCKYRSMSRVYGTEIYINSNLKSDKKPGIETWVKEIQSGRMIWYRGLPTTHFTYPVLCSKHVLVGDGMEDLPTFTMGDPTRWVPGDQDPMTCVVFASYVNDQDGLQEILLEVDLVVGVILGMRVDPSKNPVAYLTPTEQVVRTPIREENLCITHVILRGPNGMQIRPFRKTLWYLPPQLPYKGRRRDPGMIDGIRSTLLWMQAQGFLPPGGAKRAFELLYGRVTRESLDLAGQPQHRAPPPQRGPSRTPGGAWEL